MSDEIPRTIKWFILGIIVYGCLTWGSMLTCAYELESYIASTNLVEMSTLNEVQKYRLYYTLVAEHDNLEDGPPPDTAELMQGLSIEWGVPLSEIARELERVVLMAVHENWPEENVWPFGIAACSVLGRLEYPAATNTLLLAMTATSDSLKDFAVVAYIQLTKENCLPEMKKVVLNQAAFSQNTRYSVYRLLLTYAKADADYSPLFSQFLLWAASLETDKSVATVLEAILYPLFPEYKNSIQRKQIASHFIGNPKTESRYFRRIFNDLNMIPEDELFNVADDGLMAQIQSM